jgi:hypothetical protein
MNDREFSDIEIFQHSGKGIPLFMTGHKNCLQADYLLGPGPRLIKKKLPGRDLTKVEKHWIRQFSQQGPVVTSCTTRFNTKTLHSALRVN